MTRPMTPALARAYASAPYGVVIHETVQISHPTMAQVYYLTNAHINVTAKIEGGAAVEFQSLPFAVQLPDSDGQGRQDVRLVLGNVDRVISDAVQAAHRDPTQRIEMTYRVFLSTELDAPQSAPITLHIDSVQIDKNYVSATAGRSDILNRRFPSIVYDTVAFPGLDR